MDTAAFLISDAEDSSSSSISSRNVLSSHSSYDDKGKALPVAMTLPPEILQNIYFYLSPSDFNAARRTCKTWFSAGYAKILLIEMLKRGGWWSSIIRILTPMRIVQLISSNHEMIMTKWLARECALADVKENCFREVGYTDFSSLVPGAIRGALHGALSFTVSLCGRFLLVTYGDTVCVYELNHTCAIYRSRWTVPLQCRRRREAFPLGSLRPVTTIVCPKTVISCSMDTSAGRNSVAFLMEGRSGLVCDILPERLGVDALTGRDLNRWFPLTSPSDFLYFLPPRRGIDTARKLRLISSAAGLGGPLDGLGNVLHGFSTTLFGTGSTSVVSFRGTTYDSTTISGFNQSPTILPGVSTTTTRIQQASGYGFFRRVSAGGIDHFRAVPLGDGHHILFTDPQSGNLCLGTDAPVGSLTRLIRKVWFSPPPEATSSLPILYTAGSDVRHGVRVAATFAVKGNSPPFAQPSHDADEDGHVVTDSQIIVFYTIPPDMFRDISHLGLDIPTMDDEDGDGHDRSSEWVSWRQEGLYHEDDIFSDPFTSGTVYPLEIRGQTVAKCNSLVEIALNSSPDMVIWAFSAEGWGKAWAMDTGGNMAHTHSVVQPDYSIRYLDPEGDLVMAEEDELLAPRRLSAEEEAMFDGASSVPRVFNWGSSLVDDDNMRFTASWMGSRMSGPASIDMVEEVSGIARVSIELR